LFVTRKTGDEKIVFNTDYFNNESRYDVWSDFNQLTWQGQSKFLMKTAKGKGVMDPVHPAWSR
jgi:hypothetical protein